MPEDVQQAIGKALMVAEFGGKDRQTENFGAGIHEIKVDHDDSNTYRCVYTVEKPLLVYVLHTWMKKSHFKGKMDQKDKNQIERRRGTIEDRYHTDVEEKYGVKIDAKTNNVKIDA